MTEIVVISGLLMGFVVDKCYLAMQPVTEVPRLTLVSNEAGSRTAQLLSRCAQGIADQAQPGPCLRCGA